METMATHFEVNSFTFESGDQDVLMLGTVAQGTLSYQTELLLSQTQLNRVLNQLGSANEGFELESYLSVTPMEEQHYLYYADFSALTNTSLDLTLLHEGSGLRQIRA